MLTYATAADLDNWLPVDVTLPDDAEEQLLAASYSVAVAANRNPYFDAPDDQDAAVLRDAACAQVAAWIAAGLNPAAGGITAAPVKRSSILDATVEKDTAALAVAVEQAARELAPRARDILQAGGLLWVPVPVSAPDTDGLPAWGLPVRRGWPTPWRDPLTGESRGPFPIP